MPTAEEWHKMDLEVELRNARAEIQRLRSVLHDIWTEPLDDEGYGDAKRLAYEALHSTNA